MSAVQRSRGLVVAVHAAVLAVVFVALAAWTWGTWPDVLVDFGRELYVPWRLSEGQQLYTDVAYFNGPLSPHWNALLFQAFGVGLSTLVWSNLVLFAALLALLHYVLRAISTPLAATAACIVVMCTCGFGQLVGIGNYNYVCPYSHEATHGMLLGVAALACVQRWSERRGAFWAALAGACVGLAFLTKPEVFVAALLGASCGIVLRVRSAELVRTSLAFACGALAPIAAAWCALALASSSDVAWTGTLGAWPSLFASDVAELRFYRAGMGLDEPVANAGRMLAWACGALAMLVPSLLVARFVAARTGARVAALAAFVLTAAAMGALYPRVPWLQVARPWPLFSLAVFAVAFARRRSDARAAGAAAFAFFALAMLGKMLLNARLMNYGFALAMPATALCTVALFDWLPSSLSRWRIDAPTLRAGAAAVALAFAAIHLDITEQRRATKSMVLGSDADALRTDPIRGAAVEGALQWIEREFAGKPRPTMAVLPEGVTVNYLARLPNPTPYINFMPPELVLFGEPSIVAAFDAHPPDVILLVHKNTSEYGLPWFGRDYARELWTWLGEHYQPAALFGDQPLQPASRFGIGVLVRRR